MRAVIPYLPLIVMVAGLLIAVLVIRYRSSRILPMGADDRHRVASPPAPEVAKPTYFVDPFAPYVYSRKDDTFGQGYSRMSDARRGAARLNAREARS